MSIAEKYETIKWFPKPSFASIIIIAKYPLLPNISLQQDHVWKKKKKKNIDQNRKNNCSALGQTTKTSLFEKLIKCAFFFITVFCSVSPTLFLLSHSAQESTKKICWLQESLIHKAKRKKERKVNQVQHVPEKTYKTKWLKHWL